MSAGLSIVSYLGATILFILCLGGLSNQETARRGNLYGIIGMTIAVLATVFGPRVGAVGLPWIIGAMVVGGAIGLYAARVVQMTQMPELVALMHSLVGLAACLVGFASYIDTSIVLTGAEKAIHEVEIYVGIVIGAITFSGSLIAFGKLSGKIGENPSCCRDGTSSIWPACSSSSCAACQCPRRPSPPPRPGRARRGGAYPWPTGSIG